MNVATSSRSLRVFETICQELLTRLGSDTSERGAAFTAEVHELSATLARWAHDAPTQTDRAAVISRVLELHRKVMEYLIVGSNKTP